MSTLIQRAKECASRCHNAYSVGRYRSWAAVAKVLLQNGYNEQETEAIMRSKWTRWASDLHGGNYYAVPAKAIIDYIGTLDETKIKQEIADFVKLLPQNQISKS